MTQLIQMIGDFRSGHAAIPALGTFNGQKTDTRGEHETVDHVDAFHILGCQTGSAVGTGQFRTDIQMNDLITLTGVFFKEIGKVLDVGSRSLGKTSVFVVTGKHVHGSESRAIQKALFSERDGKRDDSDIITFDQLLGQVHSAVGGNHYWFAHGVSKPFKFFI